jgi:hypothetical protein
MAGCFQKIRIAKIKLQEIIPDNFFWIKGIYPGLAVPVRENAAPVFVFLL